MLEVEVTPSLPDILRLDPGEKEAIHLALAIKADLIIIDEIHGRHVARELNLPAMGTPWSFASGEEHGALDSVKNEITALQERSEMFLHPNLVRQVLELAGEP